MDEKIRVISCGKYAARMKSYFRKFTKYVGC